MTNEPFIIERVFPVSPSVLWKALTNKDQMKNWYFELNDFIPEKGFEFTFEGKSDDVVYVHLCKIIEVVPDKKLSYSWRYKDYPGYSVVTFELSPENGNTKLKLTHEGLETFPQDTKDFAKESFAAGWTAIIGNSLKNYIEKKN